MTFTSAEIGGWLGSVLWPMFRIAAMAMAMPVVGAMSVPAKLRLIFVIALTLIIAPTLPAMPQVDPISLQGVFLILEQIVIGVTMGFALQLVFATVITGGQVVAMQMGLGFASMVDPQNGLQVPVISQIFLFLATLLFLVMDGHLLLVQLMADSFRLLPIGEGIPAQKIFWGIAIWGSKLFAGAIWMALPLMVALFVVNIAFGVMARAAPQLNIFVIGFPLAMISGYFLILYNLPNFVPQFTALLESGFELIETILSNR